MKTVAKMLEEQANKQDLRDFCYDMMPYQEKYFQSNHSFYVIYPKVLSIGWLDYFQVNHSGYFTGKVTDTQLKKLEKLTDWGAFWQKPAHLPWTEDDLIIFVDKVPHIHPCPICCSKIWIYNEELNKLHPLGIEKFFIPSVDKKYLFCAPSLLLHFVREHNYLPPKLFLDALEQFDMTHPFYYYTSNYWSDSIKVY